MYYFWWLAVFCGVMPVLDPIHGSTITAADAWFLPNGRHLGYWGDFWFLEINNQQPGGGGIDMFEPLVHSLFGHSRAQMQLRLGFLEITDPAAFGTPLVDIPSDSWQTLHIEGLWPIHPAATFTLTPPATTPSALQVLLRSGGMVGGGVWQPRHFFDRELASDFGAPIARRALVKAFEGSVLGTWQNQWGLWQARYEQLHHHHQFLTQSHQPRSNRETLILTYSGDLSQATFVWQHYQRPDAGAASRLPQSLTINNSSDALIAQLASSKQWSQNWQLDLAVGGSGRTDHDVSQSNQPITYDLQGQWLWLQRPPWPNDKTRFRLDGFASLRHSTFFEMQAELTFAAIYQQLSSDQTRVGITANSQPALQLVYRPPGLSQAVWQRGRLQLRLSPWQQHHVDFLLEVEANSWQSPTQLLLLHIVPAFGLKAATTFYKLKLFVLLRTAPEAVTQDAAWFLNPTAPQGLLARWQDNGNLGPNAINQGETLRLIGSRTHRQANNLRQPLTTRLAFGGQTPEWWPFTFVAAGVVVLRTGSFAILDDGLLFALYNRPDPSFHLGIDLQWRLLRPRFFVILGAVAFMSAGKVPLGIFIDRNDTANIVEPIAADAPQHDGYGRLDDDRSYVLKVLAGGYLYRQLSLALAGRFRDGQPFTGIALTQANHVPGVQMTVPRGDMRFTASLLFDLRLAYRWTMKAFAVDLALDVFNVLGADTEILEDPRPGPTLRDSLEGMPDRSVLLTLAFAFMPS